MAENLTPQPDINLVRDLLSPYLDDEVTDEERTLVDAALADSAQLRDELEALRQTVALVAQLPHIPAPRPFTLTQADVQAVAPKAKKSFRLPVWFGGFAAAGALLVCVLAVGGLFWTSQNGGGMVGDIAMAPQQAVEEAAMEQPAEEPAPAAKEMPLEEAAEAELLVETVEVEQEAAKEVVVEEKAEAAPNLAPAPAQATGTAGLLADTDTAGATGEEALGMQALPTPTPAPSRTTTPSPALAAPAAPGEARDAASSEESAPIEEESATTEGESAAAKASGASIPTAQDDVAHTAEAAQPTATAIALLTLLPPETPQTTPAPSEPAPETPPAAAPLRTSFVIGIIFILIILVVIAVGVIIWRARR